MPTSSKQQSSRSSARRSASSRRPSSTGAAARPTSPSIAATTRSRRSAQAPRGRSKLKGPSDHDVPVLAVKDADGKLSPSSAAMPATPPSSSGYDWSGDYPGYFQIELEEAHPGAIALFWAGCGADQNPLPRRTARTGREIRQAAGRAPSNEVLAKPLTPVTGSLQTTYTEIPLALATLPTRDELVAQTEGHQQVHRHAGQDAARRNRRRQAAQPDVSLSRPALAAGQRRPVVLPRRRSGRRFRHPHQSRAAPARRPGSPATPTT